MPKESIRMSKQVRPSELEVVSLDDSQERRFRKLEEEAVMIDLHEHPMVKPEDPNPVSYTHLTLPTNREV